MFTDLCAEAAVYVHIVRKLTILLCFLATKSFISILGPIRRKTEKRTNNKNNTSFLLVVCDTIFMYKFSSKSMF